MIVTLFESVQKAYTRSNQIIDSDWPTIANFLTTFNQCDRKEDMQLFNLWEFNQLGEPGRKRIYENGMATENYEEVAGTIRRCKANAQACWGIVLDFDGEARISETVENLTGLTFALYTTFRHTEETHKFRIVLPFARPATQEEVKRKKASISETFTSVDHASFSESQSFYLHSGADKSNAMAFWCIGEFLNIDDFTDEVVIEKPELPKQEFTGDRNTYKETLIDSLATCSGLHYANEASKYGVLTLVALCKSADFSYQEYDTICHNMAAPDSSLQNDNLRRTAWMGWNPHNGITKEVREEFIKAYGGKSKFGVKKVSPYMEKILDKYKEKK